MASGITLDADQNKEFVEDQLKQEALKNGEIPDSISNISRRKIKEVYIPPEELDRLKIEYSRVVVQDFEDDYHKEMNYPLAYESNLHRIFEFIETQDIKNGVDTYLTDENDLAFRAFGQHYMANGKDGLLTTLITVKCFGEGRSPIDMSKVFTPPTQALEKELSV